MVRWCAASRLERALEVFSRLRVWDTEENCGVLIYLLMADREGDRRRPRIHKNGRRRGRRSAADGAALARKRCRRRADGIEAVNALSCHLQGRGQRTRTSPSLWRFGVDSAR